MEHRWPSVFRSFCITLMLLLPLGLCGCTAQPEADTFFFQYEGYFAAPVSSTLTVAITGFSTEEACAAVFQNAASTSFVGNNAVRVKEFSIEPRESIGAYSACVVTATLVFEKSGVTEATALRLQFEDGSEQTYPIGTWTFDVQDAPDHSELLNVLSSPVSNRVGNVFPYHYELLDQAASIQSIQYGPDQIADVADGGITVYDGGADGKLALSGDAPVRLIRPRITVEQNGETYSVYGICCYCGALDVTEADIQAARDAASRTA